MNNQRRKKLATAIELLNKAKEYIEGVCNEEQDALYNMPENLQYSTRYEDMEENVTMLDEVSDYIDECIDTIREM